jgi:hypothetical protein
MPETEDRAKYRDFLAVTYSLRYGRRSQDLPTFEEWKAAWAGFDMETHEIVTYVTLSCGHVKKVYPNYSGELQLGMYWPCFSSCDQVPSGGKGRTVKTISYRFENKS